MTALHESSRQEGAITTRFAPSPTGALHLGHAHAAIRAHDFARERDGRFLLRIEDIDGGRSRTEHVAGILDDLGWLGLAWDGPVVHQSDRLPLYSDALDRLREAGLLYPCFCTRADIAVAASAPHGSEGAPYPGTCRTLDPVVAAARIASGAPHAWRLLSAAAAARTGPLHWRDMAAGTVSVEASAFGDVVLARKDAPASYHLAVTVDDAAQGVTDVVRGIDLFAATGIHRLLQALLGLPTPAYHHHPLVVGPDGRRLAKRTGAPALREMRRTGLDGPTLATSIRNAIALGNRVDTPK